MVRIDLLRCIRDRMSLPTAPEDQNLPKGPNFLAVVIGFAVAILLILLGTWLFLGHRKNMVPLNTKGTPSQTYLRLLRPPIKTLRPPATA